MYLSTSVRLALLLGIFLAAISWLYFLVTVAAPDSRSQLELAFPSNLSELKRISAILAGYSTSHSLYVFTLFSSAYIFKQTFAIPGSVFMNLLGGAIYGLWFGFPLCCLLTATGATCCYLLASLVGQDLVQKYLPRQLATLRARLPLDDPLRLFSVLITIRIFPMSPNWALNMASPLVGVPPGPFFLTVLLGLVPYNFVCVQTGSLLAELQSLDDLFNLKTFVSLVAIAIVFGLPMMLRRRRTLSRLHEE